MYSKYSLPAIENVFSSPEMSEAWTSDDDNNSDTLDNIGFQSGVTWIRPKASLLRNVGVGRQWWITQGDSYGTYCLQKMHCLHYQL